MYINPSVTTWITVDDGCPISCQINGSGELEFVCGTSATEGFGLTMCSEALREFLTIGIEALNKMDAIHATEEHVTAAM